MADDPLPDDLKDDEKSFLVQAAPAGILALHPREDPMIAGLLERGYLDSKPDVDPDYEMLVLTSAGKAAVGLVSDEKSGE